jgi:hypothetical protein
MNALDAERTKEWKEYRNWLAHDLYEHEGPSYWPWVGEHNPEFYRSPAWRNVVRLI